MNNLISKLYLFLQFLITFLKKCKTFIHKKKRRYIPFYAFVGYLLFVILLVKTSGDSNFNKTLPNKRINDVTAINPIQVGKQITPKTIQEIIDAIQSTTGPISIGGGRYSMGGQIGYENSLHVDMRQFNKVLNIDIEKKQVTVQSGILWRNLQKAIDPHNLSIKIMQTYANFTVGGSLSVNCHGRYIGHGPIISSVQHLKLITASGEIITASRNENQEIFNAAIGGYGGIGVIVEATLQLEDNVKVERQTKLIDVKDYNDFFNNNIGNNKDVVFQNGDLYPPNYDVINNVSWVKTTKKLTDTTRVTPEDENYWIEPKIVELVSWGNFGKWVRRTIIDPILYSTEKVVWRNKEASYDVRELEPGSREEQTYVLQEYFIPINNIQSFIPKMKAIYDKYDANIINISLRHAYPDKESYLSWAREEVFAFVVYYKQGTDQRAKEIVKQWTVEITDAILSENGAWYLPYQPHATVAQFQKGFPNSSKYFETKNSVDSTHRFTNKLLDKYNPYIAQNIEKQRDEIKGYYREEEQTILTVPEWYLVFNPKEYADYLTAGNNPSDFPFYASIDEYWSLYDKSMKLVSKAYPENKEYTTMLKVIGVSITLEYAVKILYENTIGRLFGWFTNSQISDEEKTIIEAQRAYSDFIYHTAWYEFQFMPWIKKVWSISNTAESNWLRKMERTLFFTFEFTFKAGYAQLIEWAAKASYEEPVTDIYLLISSNEPLQALGNVKIMGTIGNKQIIGITRWGAFTETILTLCEQDLNILEIGGNDEIAISIIKKNKQIINFNDAELLYDSKVVTNNDVTRLVYLLPTNKLLAFVKYAKTNNIEVEHVFDY
ncbi:MAG: FAD-dependent oxidoreductase [Flavobacteriales bacterium]